MTQVSSIDFTAKRIYLHQDTVTAGFDTMQAYFEIKNIVLNTPVYQNYTFPLSAEGNIPKGDNKFTPRYVLSNEGWRYVPYALTSHTLRVLVEPVSKDGLSGRDVFDRLGININIDIDEVYEKIEIRTVSTGSASVDANAVALAVEAQLADDFANINTKLDTTPSAVWDVNLSLHQDAGSTGLKLNEGTTGTVTVDNTAIAQEVESLLVDNFNYLDLAIGNVPAATEVELTHRFDILDANIASIATETGVSIPNQISSLNDFNPAVDTVARVTLVDTTTSNTDMRGTDNAITSVSDITTDMDNNSSKLNDIDIKTTNIDNEVSSVIKPLIEAIKAVIDKFRFTKPNEVDVNVKSQNDATLLGKGISTDKWRGE